MIFVVIILVLFLLNFRTTFITLTALPLSIGAALLILHAWGASINVMTLGGLGVAIGSLVDDAIVDVENVFRRLRQNAALPPEARKPALQVVYEASVEVRSAILVATVIIVLVFAPLFLLSGVEGRFFRPLGAAYVISLGASLIVARHRDAGPVLLAARDARRRSGTAATAGSCGCSRRGYTTTLAFALRWKALVVGAAVAARGGRRAARLHLRLVVPARLQRGEHHAVPQHARRAPRSPSRPASPARSSSPSAGSRAWPRSRGAPAAPRTTSTPSP